MLLSHVVRILRAWRRYHATVRELSMLSDHQLADLGLTRSQIGSVAYRCAWDGPASATGHDPRIGRPD
jgi:uncharacterized protein YjiS (DUF1127 family)